jgi:DNA helicase-2/ATP-dependent DNA helicase PcrA
LTFKIREKRQSILTASGHCLVTGGPGSGKTTLALLKALRRIDQGLRPGQLILFLSFSRAAVAQIAGAAKRELPHDGHGLLSIQTFHSFFWRILQGHGYLLGAPRPLRIVQAHEETSLRDGLKPGDPGWAEWEERRLQMFHVEGLICFDLFAPLAAELLQKAARLRDRISQRHPLILVDEAQDTNEEQWACIQLLSGASQVVCLADPDQMIYDHLPGVSENRLPAMRAALKPLEIDLGSENNRSPGTEIAQFARDVYLGRVRDAPYSGVTVCSFPLKADKRDKAIRGSVGFLRKLIKAQTGSLPESIVILASYSKGVAIISAALQQDKAIPHHVLFDEAFALLSARVAAFLLEPKRADRHMEDVAGLLELVGAAFRAKGTGGGRSLRDRCLTYVQRVRAGKMPKVNVVMAAEAAVAAARERFVIGDPRRDWSAVKRIMSQTGERSFEDMASQLDYLVAFARGRRISEALSAVWTERGAYEDARGVLDAALAQDQLLSAGESLGGIHVMNSHKAKGKQFDGVVLYRQEHHSPFVWRGDVAPYPKSRRLLHMAITRACKHVLILTEAYPVCPILKGYKLR